MITAQISIFAFYAARAILYFLLVLSFFTVAFFIERLLFFRRALSRDDDRLVAAISAAEDREGAYAALTANRCDETAVIQQVLGEGPKGAAAFKELLAARLAMRRRHWERFSDFLGTVGSNAPFIGLLGTVLGIMKSFADLAVTTKGGPQAVMSGISEALIATAVGLAVAIPAIVFFNFCKARVRRSAVLVEVLAAHLLTILWSNDEEK